MPVEGISMTSVFSLVAVALAISLSAFLGGYYLQPSFDIDSIMASVAYDIATMYDIAYTLPGEVSVNYYGPSACFWDQTKPSDNVTSFHCFSGDAVIIDDIVLDNELLYVYNDPYMQYDYDPSNLFSLPPESIYYLRPAFLSIGIQYYNAQLCSFTPEQGFSYCAQAYAPFAGSYSDLSILAAGLPYSVPVNDWHFVVTKANIGNYYETIDFRDYDFNPDSLARFLGMVGASYNSFCYEGLTLDSNEVISYNAGNYDESAVFGVGALEQDENNDPIRNYVYLFKGIRWRVYEESDDPIRYWSFESINENSETFDSVNYTTGVVHGADLVSGYEGNGLSFDKSESDYVIVEDPYSDNAFLDEFSVSLWVNDNTGAGSGENEIISKGDSFSFTLSDLGYTEFEMRTTNSRERLWDRYILTDNEWSHVAFVYNSTHFISYINGELKELTPATGNVVSNDEPLLIGGDSLKFFDGIIDEIKIYNRALSSEEISDEYNEIYNYNIICQERLFLDPDNPSSEDLIVQEYGDAVINMSMNTYIPDFCVYIDYIIDRNPCDLVSEVKFSDNFVSYVNDFYSYYASGYSCLKPFIRLDGDVVVLDALPAWFNYFTGECDNRFEP